MTTDQSHSDGREDRHDVTPNGFIAGEDILAGAVLGTDPKTGHLVMVGRIEPPTPKPPGPIETMTIGGDLSVYCLREHPDGITDIILTPAAPTEVAPVLGAEVTVTFRVTGVRREERA